MVDTNGNFNWFDRMLGRDHKSKTVTSKISRDNLNTFTEQLGNLKRSIAGVKDFHTESDKMDTDWGTFFGHIKKDLKGTLGGLSTRVTELETIHTEMTNMTEILSAETSNNIEDALSLDKELNRLLKLHLEIAKKVGTEIDNKSHLFGRTNTVLQLALKEYRAAVIAANMHFKLLEQTQKELTHHIAA